MNHSADNKSFLFVMDAYETLNLQTETSLLLMQELLQRGHQVSWLQEEDLALQQNQPAGIVYPVLSTAPFKLGMPVMKELRHFDAMLVRKDPPFNARYLQLTLILDHLDSRVLQFNEVSALRNFNEKMLPLHWPEFMPPTLVSMNEQQLTEFLAEHRTVILKPLDDCSGRGIVKLSWDDEELYKQTLRTALQDANGQSRYLMAQRYLSSVSEGDKRVYLLDGEAIGSVNRIPQSGNFLANIHQGARCEPTELSEKEKEIIRTIKPFLHEHGIFLAGADFIGGYLTELNITSPSALRQINAVDGTRLETRIVDLMLHRIAERDSALVAATAQRACCPGHIGGKNQALPGLQFGP